ncbi:MAG: hypothetical protein ABIB04_01170 [Patescibacteria group bacterium]
MNIPRPIVVIFCVLPWIGAIFGFTYLCLLRFPLNGTFKAETAMDGKSAWINPLLPAERTTVPGLQVDNWTGQRVIGDPTYFTARVPGPYENVMVELEYRPVHQTLAEFGVVHDAEGKDLELRPLYSEELEPESWKKASSGNISGYVKIGVKNERLADPNPSGLAIWDSSSSMPLLEDFTDSEKITAVSLRGSHDFYLVPANGKIDVTFAIQAANRELGTDLAAVRIFRGDREIKQEIWSESGSRETRMGKTSEHRILVQSAEAGVYRISFMAEDDIFIRSIKTTSQRWVIGPRIYFGDIVGYATTTFPGKAITNSRHIVAETFHNEGLQKMSFNDQVKKISNTHTPTRLDRTDLVEEPVVLYAPQGDVKIIGDGFFALRDDAFFEPKPRRLTDTTETDKEHIQAVITPYEKPEKLEQGWYRSHFNFTINPSLDRIRFVVSTPGIASRAGALDIRSVKLTYTRSMKGTGDYWKIIKQELANAWRRL